MASAVTTPRLCKARWLVIGRCPGQWAEGIAAARKVSAAAALVHDYARRARGAGMTWAQLADPLGIPHDEDSDRAEAAFEWVASPPAYRFDHVTVGWRCGSCDEYVTDNGPFGRPTDYGYLAGD